MIKKKAPNTEKVVDIERVPSENPSTILLNGANRLVSSEFGLWEDYTVAQFANKGNKAVIVFESNGFDVAVTVKGNAYFRLIHDLGLDKEEGEE